MKGGWFARVFALLGATALVLSFWSPTSPFYGALGVWMATVGSTLGKGLVFYREAGVGMAALLSFAGLLTLVTPWAKLNRPDPMRKWIWGFVAGLSMLTALEVKLLAGINTHPRFLDPWLLAYLAVTVLTGLVLVGLGRRLGEGAKTTRWLISASGLCMASLVLLPVGVLLLAFVYLLVEADLWSSTRKERG